MDPMSRVALAKTFVGGKLSNMRTMLQRANRKRQNTAITAAVESIRRLSAEVAALILDDKPIDPTNPQQDSTYGRLQGLEGAATAAYFSCFKHILNNPEVFNGRSRRPPRDPANALLSYGYTVLLHQMTSAICAVGLDPYVGYLHGSQYGKPALALDLMEEFRPLIVDSVILSVFNNGMLDEKDFVAEFGAYRLTDRGRRTFLTKLEERFDESINHPIFSYKVTYRRCLELQTRLLAKTLTGEIPAYPAFITR
jgi:CRISPR-associated protein Cas1